MLRCPMPIRTPGSITVGSNGARRALTVRRLEY